MRLVVGDCGTPWTFHSTVLYTKKQFASCMRAVDAKTVYKYSSISRQERFLTINELSDTTELRNRNNNAKFHQRINQSQKFHYFDVEMK